MLENKTFVIEPASGGDSEAHFIYRVENLRLTQGDCGHGFNMTSVTLENHIKNPFLSLHTRVRTALSGLINLDFIALLLARTFSATLGSDCDLVVFLFLWLIKKTGHLTQHYHAGRSARLDPVPEGFCLGPDTFYLHLEPKVEGPRRVGHWFPLSRCSIHLPLFLSTETSICVRK